MEIRVHLKVKVDSGFEDHIRQKIERLERLTPAPASADFYLRTEGSEYVSELVMHTGHQTIFVKQSDPDLNRSVELLLDKLGTKLSRLHDKMTDHSHR